MSMLVLKSLAIWLLLLVLAVGNGALRESVLLKVLPHTAAFVCSGVLLMAAVVLVSIATIGWLGRLNLSTCLLVGILWLALTIGFEFSFGLARGRSLSTLLDAYRFRGGDLWPEVLLIIALAPAIGAYCRGLLGAGGER
jgi:hypothetical protein